MSPTPASSSARLWISRPPPRRARPSQAWQAGRSSSSRSSFATGLQRHGCSCARRRPSTHPPEPNATDEPRTMAAFTYDAVNAQGFELSGEVHAPDLASAREQLQARGLLPQSLSERAGVGEISARTAFKKV